MSRSEDYAIAEQLFGWKRYYGFDEVDDVEDPSLPYVMVCDQSYFTHWSQKFGASRQMPAHEGVKPLDMRCPAYTSDPAADYSVMEKVRSDKQLFRCDDIIWFEGKLHSAYLERWAKIDDEDSMLNTLQMHILFYQVGDYSRAALAVLKAKESTHV